MKIENRKNIFCKKEVGYIAIALSTLSGGEVISEEADSKFILEEIIVTATKRNETVQDIPSNIQAITGDSLAASGVNDINGLVRLVPGLSMFDEGPRSSGNRNNFNIRGLNAGNAFNNDDNPSASESSVSTYLGETPIFFPLKLVDMERVEVLRGPQGTLYGSGSVGGTIRFIPKKPDLDSTYVSVNVETSFTQESNDASYDGHVIVNLPISDKVAFRGSAGREYISGFIDDVDRVQHTGSDRHPGPPVLADPSDPFSSPAVRGGREDDFNEAEVTFFRGSVLVSPNDELDIGVSYFSQTTEAEGRNEHNPFFGGGEDYVSYKGYADPQESSIDLLNMDVEVDLGFAMLTSATGYSEVETDGTSESSGFLRTNIPQYYFGFPRLFAPIERSQQVDTFTQELRLVSQTEGPVDWIVGAYYLERDTDFTINQLAFGLNDYTNNYLGLNPSIDFGDTLATGILDSTFEDIAFFGEVTWHITDEWQITGGARFFKQELEGDQGTPLPFASRTLDFFYGGDGGNDLLLGGIQSIESDDEDSIFKVNTSYDLNEDTLVYFTWAQGFRAGGANAIPAYDPLGNNSKFLTFEHDTVENWEIGIKGTLEDRLNYVATIYNINWEDFQTSLFTQFGIAFVGNLPEARSRGVELELNGYLTENITIGAGYTYIDAETRKDFEMQVGNPASVVPAGTSLPGSSEHMVSGYMEYNKPLENSELVYHLDVSYRSESDSAFIDSPQLVTDNFVHFDSITVVNASVRWEINHYTISLFGENLTNDLGTTIATSADFFGAQDQGYGVIRPRTWGLRFSWVMDN